MAGRARSRTPLDSRYTPATLLYDDPAMPADSTSYSRITRITRITRPNNRRYISMGLTHFDETGRARMVDISAKTDTVREAIATGTIYMRPDTLELIRSGHVAKGDVLAVAQVAGIMGAKQTAQLIPMCHSLLLTNVEMTFATADVGEDLSQVSITATVRTVGKTGAEMEALTSVSIAALTIYDMCKAVDREMTIANIQLVRKSGGKSGVFERGTPQPRLPNPDSTGSPG
jgi:cyclic pyranopterin monophosphate synthase